MFISEREHVMTRRVVSYIVENAAGRADLDPVHPHMPRYNCHFARPNVTWLTMKSLFKTRHTRWHRRLISLILLGLFATQMTGVIHAADLDAHDGAKPCQICKIVERTGTVPPTTATATLLFEATRALPEDTSTSVVPALHRNRPPPRAPPR